MEEKILPKLLVNREEARKTLEAQIKKGQQLRARKIQSQEEILGAFGIWSKYNRSLLLKLFDTPAIAEEYYGVFESTAWITAISVQMQQGSFTQNFDTLMNNHINHLNGIREQLELYEEPSDLPQHAGEQVLQTSAGSFDNEVFIVHGRDDEAKVKVARFVEKLGVEATILHEKPSSGLTIIEKIEKYSDRAGFAIVLLTPDDIGALKHNVDDEANPRARQNVVFELGYFMGKLGRERVCPLFKGEIEKPSDIDGIVFVPMDDANGWQLKLAQEMKQAGLPVDMNKLV